jgi:hypothetical protein
MSKGTKAKIVDVHDADVAKFPGVDGTLEPGVMDDVNKAYRSLTAKNVQDRVEKIKLEGKMPKKVDGYFRTAMPNIIGEVDPHGHVITEERVIENLNFRIPARHHMENDYQTFTMVEVAHPEARSKRSHSKKSKDDYVSTFVNFAEEIKHKEDFKKLANKEGMLPTGTQFTMKYFKSNEDGSRNGRFGVISTKPMNKKDEDNMVHTLRTILCTKIIPKLGKAILRDTTSKLGYMMSKTRDENDKLQVNFITCTEVRRDGLVCGGKFKRDSNGEYVCENCGIIYEREVEVFEAAEESFDQSYGVVEEEESTGTFTEDYALGSEEYGTMKMISARAARNYAAFRASISVQPPEEKVLAARMHADKQRSDRAKKATMPKRGGHEVYENKFYEASKDTLYAKVLHAIKYGGMVSSKQVYKTLEMHPMQVSRAVDALAAAGRINKVEFGTQRRGKSIKTYPVYGELLATLGNERPIKVQVDKVLPQVQYGGIARKNHDLKDYTSRTNLEYTKEHATYSMHL